MTHHEFIINPWEIKKNKNKFKQSPLFPYYMYIEIMKTFFNMDKIFKNTQENECITINIAVQRLITLNIKQLKQ
jgi:hypothetical protein